MFVNSKNIFQVLLFIGLFMSSFAVNARDESGKNYFVYVSLRDENAVAIYKMNKADGGLVLIEKQTVEGGPGSMNFDPSENYLYVAQREIKSFASFKIDHKTGKLSFMNSIPAADNPVYNATDRTGKYLLTAYYAGGKSAIYSIDAEGKPETPAKQVFEYYANPHSILTDASNRYLFIPDKGGDKIYQYKFDEKSGEITSNNPSFIITDKNTGPRHFVFNNSNTIVYFVNELNGTVSAFNLNGETGTLLLFQTISTLPENYTGKNTSADIHLTPDNKFLYATNRGPDNIAAFSVDQNTGELKNIEIYPTTKNPRSFKISPDGKYIIVAGEESNKLEAYSINQESGELESLYVIEVGLKPSWVLITGF